MPQYGSEQYGLYSGYIKPLLQQRGQLPQNYQRITPEFIQENILPYMGGGITRAQGQVINAIKALRGRPFYMKGSSKFENIEKQYRKAAHKFHPDVRGKEATGTFQVLQRSMDVLRQNRDILRNYGIF